MIFSGILNVKACIICERKCSLKENKMNMAQYGKCHLFGQYMRTIKVLIEGFTMFETTNSEKTEIFGIK